MADIDFSAIAVAPTDNSYLKESSLPSKVGDLTPASFVDLTGQGRDEDTVEVGFNPELDKQIADYKKQGHPTDLLEQEKAKRSNPIDFSAISKKGDLDFSAIQKPDLDFSAIQKKPGILDNAETKLSDVIEQGANLMKEPGSTIGKIGDVAAGAISTIPKFAGQVGAYAMNAINAPKLLADQITGTGPGLSETNKEYADAVSKGVDTVVGTNSGTKFGEELASVPFIPVQTAVEQLPPQLQEPANQLLAAAMVLLPMKGKAKGGEVSADMASTLEEATKPKEAAPKATEMPTKQSEMFDKEGEVIPQQKELFDLARENIAKEKSEATTPEAIDTVNEKQQALFQVEENTANAQESPINKEYRDGYTEADTMPRIPEINKGTFGQSGAIDLSGDPYKGWFDKDELKAKVKDLSEVSTATFRKYAPDVDLGENRAGRMESIEAGKGKLPIPKLEVEKIGDKWTVVDHDGRHRSDALLKNGVSKMPVEIVDASGKFRDENPTQIRSQDMETMLPNPAFRERRAVERNPLDPEGPYREAPHYDGRPKAMQEADRATRLRNPNFGKFKQGGAISPDLIPDFRKWFGKSVLKDEQGSPKVMYHGTSKDKDFKNLKENSRGIYLTDDPKAASQYAVENDSMTSKYEPGKGFQKVNTASRVMPVYARLENPYILTDADKQAYKYATNYAKFQRELVAKAKAQGHDGIIYPDSTVVFNGEQIKSALSLSPNAGKFGQGGGINADLFNWVKKNPGKGPLVSELMRQDKRTAKEFISDAKTLGFDPTTDIADQLGMHSGSFRSILTFINNPNSLAHRTIAFFDNKIRSSFAETHVMNSAVKSYFDAGYKYYNDASRIVNGMKMQRYQLETFKKDIGIVLKMEGGAGWHDGVNFVPTVKNLMDAGMSKESAIVWNGIHTALDTTWSNLQKAALMADEKMPDRIPGYVPHQFQGPYEVRAYREHLETDPKTGVKTKRKEYFATFNSYSMKDAQATLKAIEPLAQRNKLTTELNKPSAQGSTAADIFNGMWAAKEISQKNLNLDSLMKELYQQAAQGIVTSVLDRQHPSQIGHALQRVGETGVLGLSTEHIKQAFRGIEQTSKAANDWFSRVKFATEVLFPLDSEGFLNQPNLRATAKKYVNQYFDIPDHIVKGFEEKIRDLMIRRGLDPAIPRHIFAETNSAFAKLYLVAKPAFYAANRLQSFMTAGVLLTLKAQNGGKGSVGKALVSAIPDLLKAQVGKGPLIEAAKKIGKIDPSFMDNLGPGGFKDPVAAYIERTTRSEAFIVSYHYFKDWMNHDEALSAAGNAADMVSVPYDPVQGTPNFMTRLPSSLRPVALFMTYNQHMIGLNDMQLRTLGEAVKQKNPKAIFFASAGLMNLVGTGIALFGLSSIPYMQTADNVINWLDSTFGFNFMTAKELGRHLGNLTGSPTIAGTLEFGIPSLATGMDFSSSGSGASVQAPLAYASMVKNIGGLAIAALGGAKQGGITADEAWDVIKTLPGSITGVAEHVLKGETYSDLVKEIAGEVKSYTPDRMGLHALGQERTPGEVSLNLTGAKSTRQADMTLTDRIVKREQGSVEANVKHLTNVVQESHSETARTEAAKQLLTLYYKSPESVVLAMQKYELETHLPADTRRAMAATGSTEAAQWFVEWMKQKGFEPVAGGIR